MNDDMHVKLGNYNLLEVVKEVDFGLYLDGGDDGEILLPSRYVPADTKPGDMLRVFIYLDMDERLIATTVEPLAQVGDFACLRVSWVNQFGAFLDWGLMKDLFVPFREQKAKMVRGRSYIVHVHIDDESWRIVASAKVEKYLSADRPEYEHNQEVDIMVWQATELGFKVIVDNKFSGMLFRNEVFRTLVPGQRLRAFVKQVRPDGKIDLVLQKGGMGKVDDFSEALLAYIRNNGGSIPYSDKTDAETIYSVFGVSKKTFKRAAGELYRRRLVMINVDSIELIPEHK